MKKKLIVTGASRGIGKAIALQFAREGWNMIITCHNNTQMLQETANEVASLGGNAICFTGDLSNESDCKRLFAVAREEFSSLDLLINNAGISHVEVFQDSSYDNWLEICHTNLSSVISISKKAVDMMLPFQSGKIINISSVWGNIGASCEVEYSTTKGGVAAFTKALGKELAPSGISVNSLACGFIDTDMNRHLSSEDYTALMDEIPMGRAATAEEVAQMVYLLSQSPSYFTGQVISFDGGWT